jgi:chromosome segregation ATPase
MTTDLQAQADELERQVAALRALAADEELPARSTELAELAEQSRRARARVTRASAELAELREREGAIRAARAERVRELAAGGAPVSALAAHASMSVASVRAALSNEPETDEGGGDDGTVGEMVEAEASESRAF